MATSNTSTAGTSANVSKIKVKRAKPRKIVIVLIALLILAGLAGGAGYYYFEVYLKPATKVAAAPPPADPIFIALEPVTVNLQPDDKHRFLHAGVTIKVADAKAQAQITQYLPEVRSRVLLVLSNRQSASLATAQDKAKLAIEVMAALNQPFAPNLPTAKISSVMFPVFMLQ